MAEKPSDDYEADILGLEHAFCEVNVLRMSFRDNLFLVDDVEWVVE